MQKDGGRRGFHHPAAAKRDWPRNTRNPLGQRHADPMPDVCCPKTTIRRGRKKSSSSSLKDKYRHGYPLVSGSAATPARNHTHHLECQPVTADRKSTRLNSSH